VNQLLNEQIEYKPGKYVTLSNATRRQLEAAARLDEQRGQACDDLAAFYRFAAENVKPGETADSEKMPALLVTFAAYIPKERVAAMIAEEKRLAGERERSMFRKGQSGNAEDKVLEFQADRG
jgi:hypothetical protein